MKRGTSKLRRILTLIKDGVLDLAEIAPVAAEYGIELPTELPPIKPRPPKPCVYLLRCGELYKVGITTDILGRVRSLQTANGREIEVVYTAYTVHARVLEGAIHRLFSDQRQAGEWFALDDSHLHQVRRLMGAKHAPRSHTVPRVKRRSIFRLPVSSDSKGASDNVHYGNTAQI